MKKITAKEIFTIPNILGYIRILMIPVVCVLYVRAETSQDYFKAAALLLLASSTDLFDGMIARKFNMVTELGKILDPIADKLTHAAVAFCVATRFPLMWALIALMVVKEGYMAIMGLRSIAKDQMMDGAQWYGKICTATLFVGLLALFLLPNMTLWIANTMIVIMMAVMVFTFIMYIRMYSGKIKA